jgi:hydrogenase maturation protease
MSRLRLLIIGVGNAYRRDDAVGLVVARRLRRQVPRSVAVIEASGEGTALIEAWKAADSVIIIDAVHTGAAPGTIHKLDAHSQPIPSHFFHYSTHAFSVAEAIELARALQQLPPSLWIYGIEGSDFAAGQGLSLEVQRAAREVVKLIRSDLPSLKT